MPKRIVALSLMFVSVVVLSSGARAQLIAPGPSGVVLGHLHLGTKDIETSRKFWSELGGVAVQNGQLQLIQLPGTFVMLRQAQQLSGGSDGSTVERIVLRVRVGDVLDLMRRLAVFTGAEPAAVVTSPEGLSIELRGAQSQDVPTRMERIVFQSTAPTEMRDWYVKTFGAEPSSLPTSGPNVGSTIQASLPGLLMQFRKVETAPAGTRGRGLDHIGFEVKQLEAFCKKLESSGQKLDRPYTKLPNSETAIAFLTDPWGTYIELTENLAPRQ